MTKELLLGRDQIIKGLYMGWDIPPFAAIWDSLEYHNITGRMHWMMKAYLYSLHIVGIPYVSLGVIALFVVDMDFQTKMAAAMNPLCGFQVYFKAWSFTYSLAEYIKLFKLLNKDFIGCITEEKKVGAEAVAAKNVVFANNFIKYAVRWNLFTLLTVCVMPILRSQALREYLGVGEGPLYPNKVCESEYPFEWNYSPMYEMILVFEVFSCAYAVITSSVYQVILLLLVMSFVGHLKVLGYVVENTKISDFTKGQYFGEEESGKALKHLINCIQDHQKVLRAGDELARRFNPFFTFHFMIGIIVGVAALISAMTADSLARAFMFGTICVYGLLEVALYCFCGQLLENASEDMFRKVYLCEWEEMSTEFRMAVKLMMVRSNNLIVLRAGWLYRLNLETLGKIQQVVYSAITVLSSTIHK